MTECWEATKAPPDDKEYLDVWLDRQVKEAVKEFVGKGSFRLRGETVEFSAADPLCDEGVHTVPLKEVLLYHWEWHKDRETGVVADKEGRALLLRQREILLETLAVLDSALESE